MMVYNELILATETGSHIIPTRIFYLDKFLYNEIMIHLKEKIKKTFRLYFLTLINPIISCLNA